MADIREELPLSVIYRRTSELLPRATNPRTHSVEQVAQIVASIKEFGWTNPVLIDADGGIVAGHGRVMAASQLAMESVPTITLPHLTEAQRKAYVIADNQLPQNAGWDAKLLRLGLDELHGLGFELSVLGFSPNELTHFRGLGANFTPGSEDEQGQLDVIVEITCPSCGHKFRRS